MDLAMPFPARVVPRASRFIRIVSIPAIVLAFFVSAILTSVAVGATQDGVLVDFPSNQITMDTDTLTGISGFSMPILSQQPMLGSVPSNTYIQSGSGVTSVPSFGAPPLTVTSALTFNFTKGAGILALEAGTPTEQQTAANVVQGFQNAADLWRSRFNDPVTINVTIDFATLGSGILGSTGNNTIGTAYNSVAGALTSDQKSADDATAVANLQAAVGGAIEFMTIDTANSGGGYPRIRDNDGSSNNIVLDVPRANAKALGILGPNDVAEDGSITFSDQFTWDFDNTDGVTGFDFDGVAAHEIGHLMGFVSGVDIVDITGGAGPFAPEDLDDFRVFSVLDLYRYTDDSLAQASQPAGGLNDWAYGSPSGADDDPFFSIDAGATELATFSTGSFNGDGRQASHWKDSMGLGIMDPTFSSGELGVISSLDEQAFDVIGWDLIVLPEPSSGAVILIGMFAFAISSRNRSCR